MNITLFMTISNNLLYEFLDKTLGGGNPKPPPPPYKTLINVYIIWYVQALSPKVGGVSCSNLTKFSFNKQKLKAYS